MQNKSKQKHFFLFTYFDNCSFCDDTKWCIKRGAGVLFYTNYWQIESGSQFWMSDMCFFETKTLKRKLNQQ